MTTHASILYSTSIGPTTRFLNIGKAPIQQLTSATQPRYSSYLHMLGSMLKTSIPISTSAYMYIGHEGTPLLLSPPPPPSYNQFRNAYNFGGELSINPQLS